MSTNYSRILYLGFMGFFNDQEIRAAWDELTFPSPSSLRQQGIMHKSVDLERFLMMTLSSKSA